MHLLQWGEVAVAILAVWGFVELFATLASTEMEEKKDRETENAEGAD